MTKRRQVTLTLQVHAVLGGEIAAYPLFRSVYEIVYESKPEEILLQNLGN